MAFLAFGSSTSALQVLSVIFVAMLIVFIPNARAASIPVVAHGNDTCMTRWLTAATAGSGVSSADVQRLEKVMKQLRIAVDEDNIHDTDPELLAAVLGGNEQAVNFLYRCMGNHDDTECLRQSPCQHLGRCVYSREPGSSGSPNPGYRCVCSRGVSGRFCQHALPSCSSSPCKNGGTCQETSEGYTCQCPTLYTGRHCQRQWLSKHILANMTSSLSKLTTITNSLLTSTADAVRKSSDAVAAFLSRLQGTVNRNLNQRLEAIQQNHTTYIQNSDGRAARLEQALGQLQTKFESSERNSANLTQDLNAVKSSLRNSDGRAARLEQALGQLQTKFESSNTRAASLQQTLGQLQTKFESSERNSANLRQELNAVKSSLRYLGTGCNLRTLGYKYQSRHSIGYSPDEGQIASVTFRKKHTNTVLKLSYSGNIRTYGAHTAARWYLKIDNRECARPTKIDIIMYQSSDDRTYIPAVLTGICESTYSSGANIAAGDHTITVHVGRIPGRTASDAYTGWLSTSILEIQEMCPQF
ncbi:uncharacterized protein LOC135826021 isoform X3 [Sycon ciliatum]|uniref:uncharacterized protein LOC135826021 isoform X3 n=1 Tax=Sycon ciliatum TaxID=27933 RepID=UPI0031F64029